MSTPPAPDPYFVPRSEQLDVVLVKGDVNVVAARPEDFLRVPVVARDPSDAVDQPAVREAVAKGYRVVKSTGPNQLSDVEQAARRRQHEAEYGRDLDRSKV